MEDGAKENHGEKLRRMDLKKATELRRTSSKAQLRLKAFSEGASWFDWQSGKKALGVPWCVFNKDPLCRSQRASIESVECFHSQNNCWDPQTQAPFRRKRKCFESRVKRRLLNSSPHWQFARQLPTSRRSQVCAYNTLHSGTLLSAQPGQLGFGFLEVTLANLALGKRGEHGVS